ncbi:MAG: shikimate kinase [Bdellovibrionales bacterium]
MNKSNFKNFSVPCPVVLIGMMGAGKTSVGQALAGLLSVPFFDSDAEIESTTGRSVSQIFSDSGETEFRRLERQAVERLLDRGPCVLSLGGGAFMDEYTRNHIKKRAFSVWLKVDKRILLNRVLHQGARPLLKGYDPAEKLEQLLIERTPVYAKADLTSLCNDRPVADNARQIMTELQAALKSQTA